MTDSDRIPSIDYVEPTDSSATIMRGVAAALRGTWMEPQHWPAPLVRLSSLGNLLPGSVRMAAVRWLVRNVGIDPGRAQGVSSEGLASWAVRLYQDQTPEGTASSPSVMRSDVVVMGAPSGGVGHIAAWFGAPFLSQHFVTRYRYRGHPDDVEGYAAYGKQIAKEIATHNPDLSVVNHFDPIHDRFLVSSVNYIRMKLLTLPDAYQNFLRQNLRPGGTIVYADCQYTWRQYRVGPRHYFQVGGLGGVADSDYVNGSLRIAKYLRAHGTTDRNGWPLPYPSLVQPESEWGSLPAFREAVAQFAERYGYRLVTLTGRHPEDFSRVAFYAAYQTLLEAGVEPAGVLADCFTQTSPTAALRSGLLPLWLPFNCVDSLGFLREMSKEFPKGKPVLISPVPSYSPSWDLVSARQWANAVPDGSPCIWIGTNPAYYPADLAGMFRFVPDLRSWCDRHRIDATLQLRVSALEHLVARMRAETK